MVDLQYPLAINDAIQMALVIDNYQYNRSTVESLINNARKANSAAKAIIDWYFKKHGNTIDLNKPLNEYYEMHRKETEEFYKNNTSIIKQEDKFYVDTPVFGSYLNNKDNLSNIVDTSIRNKSALDTLDKLFENNGKISIPFVERDKVELLLNKNEDKIVSLSSISSKATLYYKDDHVRILYPLSDEYVNKCQEGKEIAISHVIYGCVLESNDVAKDIDGCSIAFFTNDIFPQYTMQFALMD